MEDYIKILRETSSFSHISSTKLQVSLRLLLRVPPDVDWYIHFTYELLSEVKATDNQGRRLVIIPREELGQDFGEKWRNELRNRFMVSDKDLDNMVPLPISLADLVNKCHAAYVEIEICYTVTRFDHTGLLSEYNVFRHGYYGKDSNIYLTIDVPDKYEFQNKEFSIKNVNINKLQDNESKLNQENEVTWRRIYQGKLGVHARIDKENRPCPPNVAAVEWKIGAPSTIRWWARLGGGLGVSSVVIAPIIFYFLGYCTFSFIPTFLGGIIALMLALNVFLFHDIELMKRWNKFYIIVIFMITIVLTSIAFHYFQIKPDCNPNS